MVVLNEHEFQSLITSQKIWRIAFLTILNRSVLAMRLIVMPLFVIEINSTEAFYGLMMATAGYTQALFLFPGGTISDKWGRGVATLLGGTISGIAYFLLPLVREPLSVLTIFSLSGVGDGLMMNAVEAMLADHTARGDERTRSYGITIAVGTLGAAAGPVLSGLLLDETAVPGIGPMLFRYAILFYLLGTMRLIGGVGGFFTERWLQRTDPVPSNETAERPPEDSIRHTTTDDARTALLFGVGELMMGISSGMVVPYLIPWINATFRPTESSLGALSAVANLTLASGTFLVGIISERMGKLRSILFLYLLAPLLALGLVSTPVFLWMAVFYVARESVANMTRPATNSLFMEEVSQTRRARSWAVTRIMWNFPRQTGTLLTSMLLTAGIFGGIVEFGRIVFPLAMLLYPLSVIPMSIAVHLNRRGDILRNNAADQYDSSLSYSPHADQSQE